MTIGIKILIGFGIVLGYINILPLVAGACCVISVGEIGWSFPMLYPCAIYEKTGLNYFGVGMLYLLYIAFCPVPFLMTFTYWLTHVGRKK